MRVTFNAFTQEKLQQYLGDRPGYFKPFYDVAECGCNGMLVILIVDQPLPTDLPVESDAFSFVVDNRQECQFDEVMQIEALDNYPSFRVKSDSSLFGNNVKIRDARALPCSAQ